MKKPLFFLFSAALLYATLVIISLASCSKSDPSAQFLGTYIGSDSYGGSTHVDTLIIGSGGNSTNTNITLHDTYTNTTVNGTVSGNNIVISSQTVGLATVSGSGMLSGSNLTASVTSTLGGVNFSFSGVKQ